MKIKFELIQLKNEEIKVKYCMNSLSKSVETLCSKWHFYCDIALFKSFFKNISCLKKKKIYLFRKIVKTQNNVLLIHTALLTSRVKTIWVLFHVYFNIWTKFCTSSKLMCITVLSTSRLVSTL